jgi:tetratricopeptide (TPR) repeat protein
MTHVTPYPTRTDTPRRGSLPQVRAQAAPSLRTMLAAAALLGMALVAYAPVLRAGYIWDDNDHVTGNETLLSLDGLRQIWFVPLALPQYYPVVHSTFWIEHHLWDEHPLGYHLVNVLLHGTCAILVWRLLSRLSVPGAWLAAAIFAVHPVEVESVAWITERKNVLSLAFALGSMLAYLRLAPPDELDVEPMSGARDWCWYTLGLALFVAALLSKTVVATLPAVLLVIYWWKGQRTAGRGAWSFLRHHALPLVPFFVLGISLGLVTAWLERKHVGAEGEEWSFTAADRVLIAGRALWFYAAKLAWPQPLTFFYPRWNVDEHIWWQYLYPVSVLAAIVMLWASRQSLGAGALAAVLIFAGVLVPALGFFNVYPFRYSFVADHFQYHASVSLIALAAAGAALVYRRLNAPWLNLGRAGAGVLLVALAAISLGQTLVYFDQETLYRDTIAKNPRGWVAYTNLGAYLEAIGRQNEAVELARDAVRLNPGEPTVHNNLGSTLLRVGEADGFAPGQLDEIIAELEIGLQLARTKPGLSHVAPAILSNLGSSLMKLGNRNGFQSDQLERAIAHLNEALRLAPDFVGAHNNLASALLTANRPNEALAHYSRSLEIEPRNAQAIYGMGTVLAATGRSAEARGYFTQALAQNSNFAEAHYGLALVLIGQNRPDEAVEHLRQALRIDPRLAEVHYALAGVLAGRGELTAAVEHYTKAVEIRPSYDLALNNLGVVLMNLGQTDKAISYFQEAVRQNPQYQGAKANLENAIKAQEHQATDP